MGPTGLSCSSSPGAGVKPFNMATPQAKEDTEDDSLGMGVDVSDFIPLPIWEDIGEVSDEESAEGEGAEESAEEEGDIQSTEEDSVASE